MVFQSILGEWLSPTSALKKRFFAYILPKYLPFLNNLSEQSRQSLEIDLLGGYAKLEDFELELGHGMFNVFDGFLDENTRILLRTKECEIWIAWNRVIAYMTPEGHELLLDEEVGEEEEQQQQKHAITIRLNGLDGSVELYSDANKVDDIETNVESIVVAPKDVQNPLPVSDAIELNGEKQVESKENWIDRVLANLYIVLEDIKLSIDGLYMIIDYLEYEKVLKLEGLCINTFDDKRILERVSTVEINLKTRSLNVLEKLSIHVYPELLSIPKQDQKAKKLPLFQLTLTQLHLVLHLYTDITLIGENISLSNGMFECQDFRITCQYFSVESLEKNFKVLFEQNNVSLDPFKIIILDQYIWNLGSEFGSGEMMEIKFTCSLIDFSYKDIHAKMEAFKVMIKDSLLITISKCLVSNPQIEINSFHMVLRHTLQPTGQLDLERFYPQGHLPFDAYTILLEDYKFFKCSSSSKSLFAQLAKRTSLIIEVRAERIECVQFPENLLNLNCDTTTPNFSHDYLLLIGVENFVITNQFTMSKAFLSMFSNEQLLVGDLKARILQATLTKDFRIETFTDVHNLRITIIKKWDGILTACIDTDGLVFDIVPSNLTHLLDYKSTHSKSVEYFIRMQRSKVLFSYKHHKLLLRVDSLKLTNDVLLANQLGLFSNSLETFKLLQSESLFVRLSDIIVVEDNQSLIFVDDELLRIFGPINFSAPSIIDSNSPCVMKSLEEITALLTIPEDDKEITKDTIHEFDDEGKILKHSTNWDIYSDYWNVEDQRFSEPVENNPKFALKDCTVKVYFQRFARLVVQGLDFRITEENLSLAIKSVYGYDTRQCKFRKWPIFLKPLVTRSENVQPMIRLVMSLATDTLNLKLFPIKLRIDQDLLNEFMDAFYRPLESEFQEQQPLPKQYRHISISQVDLSIDYQPRKSSPNSTSFISILTWLKVRNAFLTLPPINTSHSSTLGMVLYDHWAPVLTSPSKLTSILFSSVTPIRTLVRLSGGIASLLILPIHYSSILNSQGNGKNSSNNAGSTTTGHHHNNTSTLRSLKQASYTFAHTAGAELTGIGASVLENTFKIINSFFGNETTTTIYDNPMDTLRMFKKGSKNTLGKTFDASSTFLDNSNTPNKSTTIIAIPIIDHDQSKSKDKGVMRILPIAMVGGGVALLRHLKQKLDGEERDVLLSDHYQRIQEFSNHFDCITTSDSTDEDSNESFSDTASDNINE